MSDKSLEEMTPEMEQTSEAKREIKELLSEVTLLKKRWNEAKPGSQTKFLLDSSIFRKLAVVEVVRTTFDTSSEAYVLGESFASKIRHQWIAQMKKLSSSKVPELRLQAQLHEMDPYRRKMQEEIRKNREKLCTRTGKAIFLKRPSQGSHDENQMSVTSRNFALIFPILTRRKQLTFLDVLKLSQKSDILQQAINSHFMADMKPNLETEYYDVLRVLSENECLTINPIPTSVLFKFGVHGAPEIIGAQILSCHIVVSLTKLTKYTNYDITCWICQLLYSMPNLRHLTVSIDVKSTFDDMDLASLSFPLLAQLKSLFVQCSAVSSYSIADKLLSSYKHLQKEEMMLTLHRFKITERWEWPLRYLRINVKTDWLGDLNEFATCLEKLSCLKKTLKELHLTFEMVLNYSRLKDLPNSMWITKFNFPRVKRFVLENCLVDSALLLRFPILEHFELSHTKRSGNVFQSAYEVGFANGIDGMKDPNLWKLLPLLRSITYKGFSSPRKRTEQYITRAQIIKSLKG